MTTNDQVAFFNAKLLPLLDQGAREHVEDVQGERNAYNVLYPHQENRKRPFALDCLEVLIACAHAGAYNRFYPQVRSHFSNNQFVLLLNLSLAARQNCAIMLRAGGFL